MSSVSKVVKELEEYARHFEANRAGAQTSGQDSVMTVTSSGGSCSSGDRLQPSSSFTSSPADLRTSHRAGLPSLPPVLASSQHTEQRDGTGALYTKMRPVFHHTPASLNDGRRKSDYYSFSSSQGGFFKPGLGNGFSDGESVSAEPRNAEGNCSTLQQSCSVSDRINQMERLARPAPAIVVVRTRTPGVTEDEFHLSKSVPNLLSNITGATAAQAQADEEEVEDTMELREDGKKVCDLEEEEDGKKGYVKLVREDSTVDDVYGYMRTKWAALAAVKKPGKEKKIVKKKKALPQKIKSKKKGFTNEEISLAATILYSSRRVYNLLRNKKLMKLPCIRTVYKKLQHFQCEPGYNPQIFRLLELKLASLKEKDRVLGISFDEMHLEEKYSWSPLLRRLFGKHKV